MSRTQDQLCDNSFFKHTLRKFAKELKDAWNEENFVLCVPSQASLKPIGKAIKSKDFVQCHMLKIPEAQSQGLTKEAASVLRMQTANGWFVTLSNDRKTLTTGEGFPNEVSVRVEFEELFYDENFNSLQIAHISKSLYNTLPDDTLSTLLESIRCVPVTERKLGQHNSLIHLLLGPDSVSRIAKSVEEFEIQLRAAHKRGVSLTLEEAAFRLENATRAFLLSEEKKLKHPLEDSVRSEVLGGILAVFLEYTPLSGYIFQLHLRQHPMENQRISTCLREMKEVSMESLGVPSSLRQREPREAIALMKNLNSTETAMSKIVLIQEVMLALGKLSDDSAQEAPGEEQSAESGDAQRGEDLSPQDSETEAEDESSRRKTTKTTLSRHDTPPPPFEPPPSAPQARSGEQLVQRLEDRVDPRTNQEDLFEVPDLSESKRSSASEKGDKLEAALSADEVLPLLAYVIIKASPEKLYTNVCFMKAMRPNAALASEGSRIDSTMAMLTAALQYIVTKSRSGARSQDETAKLDRVDPNLNVDGRERKEEQDVRSFDEVYLQRERRSSKQTFLVTVQSNGNPADRICRGDESNPPKQPPGTSIEACTSLMGNQLKRKPALAKQCQRQAAHSTSGAKRCSNHGIEDPRMRQDTKSMNEHSDSNSNSSACDPAQRKNFLAATEQKVRKSILGEGNYTISSGAINHGPVLLEGYLWKRGWIAPTFRTRYFRLHLPSPDGNYKTPYLVYSLSRNGTRRGTIAITEGRVFPSINNRDGRTFVLKFKRGKTYTLRAASIEGSRQWIEALQPLLTLKIQDAIKTLQSRIARFEITYNAYEKLITKVISIPLPDKNEESRGTSARSGDLLIRQLQDTSTAQEARELEKWAESFAGECTDSQPAEQVERLEEIAEVLNEHLSRGNISQQAYDNIVKLASN
eukprot:CAMPEP_0184485826 /NCGR_PEP_ID=MMETSP0113_2-20130426/7414_1 /TAXON_ID=91329 /ORGANISM="Norrisiella sphaerica, Strain BC52" /LENGTH=919 /DNA_ID=CAMNT_0026867465 /DNA_START=42 /DNA_END=2798 /DNA_ORIENTATION=+